MSILSQYRETVLCSRPTSPEVLLQTSFSLDEQRLFSSYHAGNEQPTAANGNDTETKSTGGKVEPFVTASIGCQAFANDVVASHQLRKSHSL